MGSHFYSKAPCKIKLLEGPGFMKYLLCVVPKTMQRNQPHNIRLTVIKAGFRARDQS